MTEQTIDEAADEADRTARALAKTPMKMAGGTPHGLIPTSLEEVWKLAKFIAAAGWAPKSYQVDANAKNGEGALIDVNKVVVGILHGMEAGFTPMASLQSIAVINGMPSIWGDGALALVFRSGLLEDYEEVISGEGSADQLWTCTAKRKNRKTPIVSTFGTKDMIAAGLDTKQGPWQQYRKRMQKMRARAFCLRDGFADVLRGLHIAEEVQDYVKDETGAYRPAERERREPDPVNMDVAAEVADQMAETERARPAEIEHQPEQNMASAVEQTAQAEPAIVRHTELTQAEAVAAGSRHVEGLKESARQAGEELEQRAAEVLNKAFEADAAKPDGAALTAAHATYAAENYESEAERVDREAVTARAAQPKADPKPASTKPAAEKPKTADKPKAEMSRAEQMLEDQRIGGEILGPEFDTGDEAAPQAAEPARVVDMRGSGAEPEAVRAELKVGNLRPWLAWFKDELPLLPVSDRPHFIARYADQIDKIEAERGASWAGLEKVLAATSRTRS